MNYLKHITLLSLLCCAFVLKGQMQSMRHFTDEQGLSSNTIYRLLQDKNGYIWFTSDEGLFRWDGLNIKTYSNKEQRGSGMNSLVQHPDGRIWVCNFVGQIFYVRNDSLIRFTPTDELKELYSCNTLSFDVDARLYFSSNCGSVWCYTKRQWKRFEEVKYAASVSRFNSSTWLVDCTVNNDKAKLYMIEADKKDSVSFECKGVTTLGETFKCLQIGDELWLASHSSKNLYCINKHKQVRTIPLEGCPAQISLLKSFVNKKGIRTFWTTSTDGAKEYTTDGKLLRHLLAGQFVTDVIKDFDDNLWFGTRGSGVYQLAAQSVLLYNVETKHFVNDNIGHLSLDTNGDLIITHNTAHITHLNPSTGKTKSIDLGSGVEFNGTVRLSNGKYFTYGNNNLIYTSTSDALSGNFGSVKNILEIRPNTILYASAACLGLIILDKQSNPDYQLGLDNTAIDPKRMSNLGIISNLRNVRTWCIERDPNPNLFWIGFADDLVLWNTETMTSQIIKDENGGSIHARDLRLLPDGALWVSTSDNGVFQLVNKAVNKHFNQDNSVISNYCRRISATEDAVAVTTGQGLFLIRTQDYSVERLDKADGLPSNDLMDVLIVNQDIWVTSPKGLLRLPLLEKWNNPVPPEIQLVGLALFEKGIPIVNEHTFLHNENNIRFDFCATSWRAPNKLSYSYRLLGGQDTLWTRVSSLQQSVRYSALSSGDYTFEVFASNEDGVNSKTIRYHFYISKPFWQQWWFYLLCLISIAAAVSLYYNMVINRLHKDTLAEQEKAALALAKSQTEELLRSSQLSSLKAQMNPHFIFNALNSLQSFILHNNALKANIYLTDFAQLMRLTLEMSHKTAISLQEELDMLRLYLQLEGVRFGDSFQYTLEVPDNINPYDLQIPSMLIQPYVENAIKHGLLHKRDNRQLQVIFELVDEEQVLKVIIKDNGVGRAYANELKTRRSVREKHSSFSTSATQERLNILNHGRTRLLNVVYEDLVNEHNEAAGTAVSIFIPI